MRRAAVSSPSIILSGQAVTAYVDVDPGHSYLYQSFAEHGPASLVSARLDPWSDRSGDRSALESLLEDAASASRQRIGRVLFLTLDYLLRDGILAQFSEMVSRSPCPCYAILHRLPSLASEQAALQRVAPLLRRVLVLCSQMGAALSQRYGLSNVGCLPHPATIERFPCPDAATLRGRLGIPNGSIVLSLLGEQRSGKGTDLVLRALRSLCPEVRRKVFFLIAGRSQPNDSEAIRILLAETGIPGLVDLRESANHIDYNVLSEADYADYVRATHIGLLLYQGPQRECMSGHLPNYLAAKSIVIATRDSYVGEILARSGTGYTLEREDQNALALLIGTAVYEAAAGKPASAACMELRRHFSVNSSCAALTRVFTACESARSAP